MVTASVSIELKERPFHSNLYSLNRSFSINLTVYSRRFEKWWYDQSV